MAARPVRTLITIVMDVLVFLAIVVVLRIVVEFFGALAAQAWGGSLLGVTKSLVIPFGIQSIRTPYAGAFDIGASLTVLVLLGLEWALGLAQRAT